ncbi:hypothetical protein LSH36_184g12000, partial [Paralvinella palmiformis]
CNYDIKSGVQIDNQK